MPTTRIAVAGGGPAGTVIAVRLVQLGHDVVLVAGTPSRRSHSVETLTPGVSKQLKFLRLGDALDGALVLPAADRQLKWQNSRFEPNLAVKPGALVERSAFDAGLITAVTRQGVTMLPAEVRRVERIVDGWRLVCESAEGPVTVIS